MTKMYQVRFVLGHYQNGNFLFSADSRREVSEELEEYA